MYNSFDGCPNIPLLLEDPLQKWLIHDVSLLDMDESSVLLGQDLKETIQCILLAIGEVVKDHNLELVDGQQLDDGVSADIAKPAGK